MNSTPTRSFLFALALAAVALPSFAAKTATKISSRRNCILYRDGTATSWASGNWVGINGNSHADELFDGDFENYINQNSAGAYLVMDLTPICVEEDGQPFVTDILIGHAGNTKYSLYYTIEEAPAAGSTSDDRTWIPVVEQTQPKKGVTTNGVNAVATAVKYVWETSLGWGGTSLAEIEVQGYEYVPPKAVKISARRNCILYRDGTATSWASGNWVGINGNSHADELFDGDFANYINQNSAGAYLVLDTTMRDNGVSTGDGYYVTDVLIGHAGNTKYSLYYTTEEAPAAGSTSDDRTWIPVVEQTQPKKGVTTNGVNAVATAVKYVWETSLGWGGTSLAEIEIWGMDPSTITCLHPHPQWIVVPDSNTCTEYGYKNSVCPDCGTILSSLRVDELPPKGHDYVSSLARTGNVLRYGAGRITCSRCDFEIDCSADPVELMQFGGMVSETAIQFSNLSVSSVGDTSWGVTPARLTDNKWTFDEWRDWHAVSRSHNEYVQIEFGTTVDLTKIEFAVANHNQTVEFWNCDGAEEVKMGEVAVKTDSSVGEFIAQRKTIYFTGDDQTTGQAVKKLRVRFTDTEGLGVNGTRPVSMGEIHPYGTVVGAGKLDPGPPMFILMQ